MSKLAAPMHALVLLAAVSATGVHARAMAPDLAAAEHFINTFYAWDGDALAHVLRGAPQEQAERMAYYQRWAKAGNYAIETRRPCERTSGPVMCAITVIDDLGGALGYIATDTFFITVEGDDIVAIESTADDPPVFDDMLTWLAETRPEVMAGPCKDLFAGGRTPEDCVRQVVRAARDYAEKLRTGD